MGFCLSCCRRRKEHDAEREPLLKSAKTLRQARTPLEKLADILAALKAGKLPSQDQLNASLRRALYSSFLRTDKREGVLDESGRKVIEDVRDVIQNLLQFGLEKNDDNCMQDFIFYARQLSTVPVHVGEPGEVHVHDAVSNQISTAAAAIPSQQELAIDAAALYKALRTLAKLILTSSTFRLILSDVLLTTREMLADTMEHVKDVAVTVEGAAEAIEENVRPGGAKEKERIVVKPIDTTSIGESEDTKSIKDKALDRVEEIIRQAQASPSYNAALRTLLYLLRKYAARVRVAAAAVSEVSTSAASQNPIAVSAPVIAPDPEFSRMLEGLKVLLERCASGKSLDPLLSQFFTTVNDIAQAPLNGPQNAVQQYFDKVGLWLDRALTNPQYASSRPGRESASKLYDEGHSLIQDNAQVSADLRSLTDEVQVFVDGLKTDKSTNNLVGSLDKLRDDMRSLLYFTARRGERAAVHWRAELLRMVLGWVLPRVLRAIKTIPMPRVEYLSTGNVKSQLAVAIDALLLSAEEEMIPDVLRVQEFGEVNIEVDEHLGGAEVTNPNSRLIEARAAADNGSVLDASTSILPLYQGTSDAEAGPSKLSREDEWGRGKSVRVSSTSRIRVHIEGLRIAAHDVGYYARYDLNTWLGYEDEGLVGVDIGRTGRRGEGLGLDVEIEMNTDSSTIEQGRLFRVVDVRSAMPGLALHISNSKHWMLNSLLVSPFAGPVGRAVGAPMLASQIKGMLEKLEEVLRAVKVGAGEKAKERGSPDGEEDSTPSDWWQALLDKFGTNDIEEDEEEQEIYSESHTDATLKGVVHTTYTQPEPPTIAVEAPPTSEIAIAVGIGAQLLPGKAEPQEIERVSLREAAHDVAKAGRNAVEEVGGIVTNASNKVEETVMDSIRAAAEVRREVEGAGERMKRRESTERKKVGWRSRVFDL